MEIPFLPGDKFYSSRRTMFDCNMRGRNNKGSGKKRYRGGLIVICSLHLINVTWPYKKHLRFTP